MPIQQNHTTNSVVMVPPTDFAYNEQTGADNEFQNKPGQAQEHIREDALCEFNEMVNRLRDAHIEVLLLNKHAQSHKELPDLPDAVFPNNWFSTSSNGTLTLYPMKTPNRRAEVRPEELTQLLNRNGYQVHKTEHVDKNHQQILEGTGSIIFDHKNQIAYAAISERCDKELFERFCQKKGYQAVSFTSQSSTGRPFYHTNVMMSVGEHFVVMCLESITDDQQKQLLLDSFTTTKKEVIDISLEQTEKSFCGNILQLHNSKGDKIIVMSDSAYRGFTKEQKAKLEKHGRLLPCPIPTIEQVGGGSTRCMLAENFMPKR
ncbi:citrulline utilization hydrolase CtlX [Kangiella sp.]|uniref:citrulline utilization hydrolase CtlX n=1 Tax=Kangiella sp. TaxID=1920245 RepID=UPI0019C3AE82|nr:arginine deiminase-related protein [Kangiella sp.]MBD3652588.1 hypothetical protein [Kangiella sp.]